MTIFILIFKLVNNQVQDYIKIYFVNTLSQN